MLQAKMPGTLHNRMPIQGTFSLKLFKETDESWEYPEAVHIRWKDFLRKNGSRYFLGTHNEAKLYTQPYLYIPYFLTMHTYYKSLNRLKNRYVWVKDFHQLHCTANWWGLLCLQFACNAYVSFKRISSFKSFGANCGDVKA